MLYGGCSQLSPERPILARTLSDAGYRTSAFTSNPHLFERFGYEVGFEEFNEYRRTEGGSEAGDDPWLERVRLAVQPHLDTDSRLHGLLRRVYYFLMTATNERPYAPADEMNEQFLDWLDGRTGEDPFFTWLHYMDAHYPFYQDEETLAAVGADPIPGRRQRRLNRLMNEEPAELSERDVADLVALYDAETRFADEQIGALLDALDARGVLEDTLVLVTSDHGEALGEHGAFGHYRALYEELLRVPLLARVPTGADATVEEQVGLVDLAPTILDYAGVEPEGAPFSGTSLRARVEDGEPLDREERLVAGHGDPLGVRTPRWKYVWWDREGDTPTDAELFDLDADPEESVDVSGEHPEVVAEFDAYLADHVALAEETAVEDRSGEAAVDEEIAEQLEALGYK
jgi:arylsulfatase A-like enzyme